MRAGFKRFPACWHLQAYLTQFEALLVALEPAETPVTISLKGPASVEKFCRPEIITPTDTAFSLPAAFSLLIEGVEPGVAWASFADDAPVFRHRAAFRYVRADVEAILVHTSHGRDIELPVTEAGPADLSAGGLDEAGVIAKFERLADPAIRSAAKALLTVDGHDASDGATLYAAFATTMKELVS